MNWLSKDDRRAAFDEKIKRITKRPSKNGGPWTVSQLAQKCRKIVYLTAITHPSMSAWLINPCGLRDRMNRRWRTRYLIWIDIFHFCFFFSPFVKLNSSLSGSISVGTKFSEFGDLGNKISTKLERNCFKQVYKLLFQFGKFFYQGIRTTRSSFS